MALSRIGSKASVGGTSIFSDGDLAGGDLVTFGKVRFAKGDVVWVRGSKETIWDMGTVTASGDDKDDNMVVVQTANGKEFFTRKAFGGEKMPDEGSKVGYKDMTAMRYVNEPQILENLRVRSLKEEPYTFLGPVLVAVNPLKEISSEIEAGDRKVMTMSHPYAVAELSYQQMLFVLRRPNEAAESPANQTIIVSGESGAGKTVSSKKVLEHLVARSGGGDLAKAMLSSNPIMEAFGNATTLRNPNSSRFGKLLKVHYEKEGAKIVGASMGTYLLERSRITNHELGERNYHIFYQLLSGADAATLDGLQLSKSEEYKILLPNSKKKSPKVAFQDHDAGHYQKVTEAMKDVGVSGDNFASVVKVLGAVLHLGNLDFQDTEGTEGKVSSITSGTTKHLEAAAQLLGVDKLSLSKVFTELDRNVGGQTITSPIEAVNARQLLDGTCKSLYNRLFTWTVNTINTHLNKSGSDDLPTIGVLDIFGFETFARNDLEQLLINYTNESLQLTFNKQVLEAEAALYQREGLAMSEEDKVALDPTQVVDASNKMCIDLLQGVTLPPEGKSKKGQSIPGVLTVVHEQGRVPRPTEKKMIEKLHKTFQGPKGKSDLYPNYLTVKKDMRKKFIIKHYAGKVTYTVGNFLDKNNDLLPKATTELFRGSISEQVKAVWDCSDNSGNTRKKDSIVSKFVKQIQGLSDDLNSTQCAFIRCIKPNSLMQRKEGWFNKRYVTMQLKNLSIPKTADVLKSGLPTRIPYAQLVESYASIFGKEIKAPDADDERGVKQFIAALFYAFEIQRSSYKLGLTRVFFKTGELDKLDEVLQAADNWKAGKIEDDEEAVRALVLQRFKTYVNRRRWRVVFAGLFAQRMFIKLLNQQRAQKLKELNSAILIQKTFRGYVARLTYIAMVEAKRLAEEKKAREEAERRAKEEAEKARIAHELELKKQAQLKEFKEQRRRERRLAKEKRDAMKKALGKATKEAAEEERKKLEKAREEERQRMEEEKAEEAKRQAELDKARKEREEQERKAEMEAEKARIAQAKEEQKKRQLYYDRMLEKRKADMNSQMADVTPGSWTKTGEIKRDQAKLDEKDLAEQLVNKVEARRDADIEKLIEGVKDEEEEEMKEEEEELDAEKYLDDLAEETEEEENMGASNFLASLYEDDDYSDYDSDSDEEDERAYNSNIQRIAVDKGQPVSDYIGPFEVVVNLAKLDAKPGKYKFLPKNFQKWKIGFVFVYPNSKNLLISFTGRHENDTRILKFNEADKGFTDAATIKRIDTYKKKKHIVYITGCKDITGGKDMDHSSENKEVIMSFKSPEKRLEFLDAVQGCAERENLAEASVDRRASETLLNMTNAEKKARRNYIREEIYKKVAILKKADKNMNKERLMKIMEKTEENEDEDEDEEFEQVPVVCSNCLEQYMRQSEEMKCPQCGEVN